MTDSEKSQTLETWMAALDTFKRRLRKCLRIVLSSGIPFSVVRKAIDDILDDIQNQES